MRDIHQLAVRNVAKAAGRFAGCGKVFVTFDAPAGRIGSVSRVLKVRLEEGNAIVRAFFGVWKLEAKLWWPASIESNFTQPIRTNGRAVRARVMFRATHLRWLNEPKNAGKLATV